MNVLLASVGGSPAPILHTIRSQKFDRIIFFTSQDTRATLNEEILPAIRKDPARSDLLYEEIVTPDPQDVCVCLETLLTDVHRILSKWRYHLKWPETVDFTGGTKAMSAAMAIASVRHPCRFLYVGSKSKGGRTKDGVGVVRDGMEQAVHEENPWNRLAPEAILDAMNDFDSARFQAAQSALADLKHRVDQGKLRKLIVRLESLTSGFYFWEIFDHKAAAHSVRKAHRELEPLIPDFGKRFQGLERVHHALPALLKHLDDCVDQNLNKGWVVDLFANANRRAAEGRYEDAVARCYAAVEKFAQLCLKENHGIETNKTRPEQIPDQLRSEFIRRFLNDDHENGALRYGLVASLYLLKELGHEAGARFAEREKQFRSALNQRNRSILAHGTDAMKEKNFRRLFEESLRIADLREADLVQFPQFGLLTAEDNREPVEGISR